jgi:hypothetical protein
MRARTLIYLDRDDLQALRAEARAQGVSLAELMRRVVREHVAGRKRARPVSRKTFSQLVALGSSGRRDISERHDAYLAEALQREHSR